MLIIIAFATVFFNFLIRFAVGLVRGDIVYGVILPGTLFSEFITNIAIVLVAEAIVFGAEYYAVRNYVSKPLFYVANLICTPIIIYDLVGCAAEYFRVSGAAYKNRALSDAAFFACCLALRLVSTFIMAKRLKKTAAKD